MNIGVVLGIDIEGILNASENLIGANHADGDDHGHSHMAMNMIEFVLVDAALYWLLLPERQLFTDGFTFFYGLALIAARLTLAISLMWQ